MQICLLASVLFQSTLPYGSDSLTGAMIEVMYIRQLSTFQSTLPYGSDSKNTSFVTNPASFQSTLPRGSDNLFDYDDKARDNFNPRSLAGATVTMLVMLSALAYFNPRSLAGATRGPKGDTGPQGISIHAPSRERLCLSVPLVKLRIISIHAPSRERLLFSLNKFANLTISIHAPSRERPKKHFKDCWRNQYFNPRSLAGATWRRLRSVKYE